MDSRAAARRIPGVPGARVRPIEARGTVSRSRPSSSARPDFALETSTDITLSRANVSQAEPAEERDRANRQCEENKLHDDESERHRSSPGQVIISRVTHDLSSFRRRHYRKLQNGPTRPTSAKTSSVDSTDGRVQSITARSRYQRSARRQHCSMETTAPRASSRISHQRFTWSSDRKARIVAHVNPTFSQNRLAGTTK